MIFQAVTETQSQMFKRDCYAQLQMRRQVQDEVKRDTIRVKVTAVMSAAAFRRYARWNHWGAMMHLTLRPFECTSRSNVAFIRRIEIIISGTYFSIFSFIFVSADILLICKLEATCINLFIHACIYLLSCCSFGELTLLAFTLKNLQAEIKVISLDKSLICLK